jgi:hypothetical protein
MTSGGLLSLPQKIEGVIFTEVALPLIPEVRPEDLVKLGAIVRKKGRVQKYEPLTDSLRKIQWVKLNGLRAVAIEREITSQKEPGAILFAPSLQIEHALDITDCVIHTKSSLDSMAIFLTDLLMLPATGGDRDLKKPSFRDKVAHEDPHLGQLINKLEPWLNELQNIRDEWIHRSSIRSIIVQGPSDVGILPIPRDVTLGSKALGLAVTKENFWSTQEFVERHYSNLVNLFQAIIERSIDIEMKDLSEPPPIPSDAEKQLMFFPTKVTENMTVTKMKVHLD